MKHCLIMTAYKPESVGMMNRLISQMPDDWGIYIHIDKKSSISAQDIDPRAHVYSLYKIYWGSKKNLDANLALMKEAFSSGADYDYYHTISAEDYWSCRPCDFDRILSTPQSYIRCHPLPRPGWFRGGYELLQYKQLSAYGDIRKGLFSVLNRLYKWFQIIFHIKQPLPNYPLFCGLANMSVHKSAMSEILHSPIAEDLMKRMENTFNPEELFFHTILMNSPLKDQIVHHHLRYIDWSSVPAPKHLTVEDIDEVLNSGTLFCRKVSDIKVAEELDARLGLL